MDTIFLKINIKKTDQQAEELREQGLFFVSIAEALGIGRSQIVEIENKNQRQKRQKINDKS
ncbi:hypothetical protein [Helicobacter pylori]|uniref:hypothetical protein n=1 Tax=Helicobacter pylori TaxID=210 RepID=UPI0005732D10|nr:hypothetical protein [Helicobacter pylori]KHL81316.1 hypothetical protein HPY1786_06500 [Helicobacter pylori]